MAEIGLPFGTDAAGLTLRLRVTPKASRDAVGEVVADAQGNAVLKVAVTAAPENGRANAAVVGLLAKSWRLRKSDMAVIKGETERNKLLRIAGDGVVLAAHVTAMLHRG